MPSPGALCFEASARTNAANSAGELPTGSAPRARTLSRISGRASARVKYACNASTTGGGVPAGAKIPNQVLMSNPGKPASASVGSSGARPLLLAVVIASALIRPALTCTSEGLSVVELEIDAPGDKIPHRERRPL